jgi:hypothetical protein
VESGFGKAARSKPADVFSCPLGDIYECRRQYACAHEVTDHIHSPSLPIRLEWRSLRPYDEAGGRGILIPLERFSFPVDVSGIRYPLPLSL